MESATAVDPDNRESMLKVFTSPSTLPHFLVLIGLSGTLYISMIANLFGSGRQGGVLFLAFSISYMIAAIISPTRVGSWMLTVERSGEGVLNRNYWLNSAIKILPIIVIASGIAYFSNNILGNEGLNKISLFLAMLFIGMSIFQGVTLTIGWVLYARRIQHSARKSRSGGVISLLRSGAAILVFLPLVWWFGYSAGSPSNADMSTNIVWIVFLSVIALLGVVMDRYTSNARSKLGADGRALDRVFFLIFITSCWHFLGALRRSPLATEQSTSGMLMEEGALMSITILLAVWSMSKKGEKKGWRIFQGQSAVFWGICFGFAYAGSISSLTALSEGSLMTTTSIGHAITAIVMLAILPMAISWVGEPSKEKEFTTISNEIEEVGEEAVSPEKEMGRDFDEEDIVELLD